MTLAELFSEYTVQEIMEEESYIHERIFDRLSMEIGDDDLNADQMASVDESARRFLREASALADVIYHSNDIR